MNLKYRKRRDRFELIKETLEIMKDFPDGARPTWIEARLIVPHARFVKMLSKLTSLGLLKEETYEKSSIYRLSEKGERLLSLMEEVEDYLKDPGAKDEKEKEKGTGEGKV
jgi:predicted transcriptional regulator